MGKLVTPKTFFVGYSKIDIDGLEKYLKYTGNMDFLDSITAARDNGLHDGEIICSAFAKLCYKSLTLGKNSNVTRVRDISENLIGCFMAGHSSVFGHCNLNFVTTDCSRVFTHELVRNHIGTEYSQTSGRYVRLDDINLILDPILDDCKDLVVDALKKLEETVYLIECRKGLRAPPVGYPKAHFLDCLLPPVELEQNGYFDKFVAGTAVEKVREAVRWVPNDKLDFTFKKKVTSAARRIAPNGQSNEIGWSINLRALRHVIQMRTSRHAEWEIRLVMNEVYNLVKEKFPMIFWGAKTRLVDGLLEVYGMKTQPYALTEEETLKAVTVDQLTEELASRSESAKGPKL